MCAKIQPARQPPEETREVRCYHCAACCMVSRRALSSSCPHCHTQLCVADIVIRARHWSTRVQTCGMVRIEPGADVRVKEIVASEGVEIRGRVRGRIRSFGAVTIADGASVDGDLTAPAVAVAPGASVISGKFAIEPRPPAA